MGKFLPLVLALLGLGAGAGTGLALKPDAAGHVGTHENGDHGTAGGATETPPDRRPPPAAPTTSPGHGAAGTVAGADYIKLNNQFVVPVVHGDRMSALVVMSLSLEVDIGSKEIVYAREPKLRDAFLRVMFDHANAGGFDGAFTESGRMTLLRGALKEVAQSILGPLARDVLIVDLVRQDA
ncbi:hypothetical protein EV663_106134 [Rhodovulum bhavnagarense]|uniref:Flagellar protein FliL n=1 Tax=Rhodovulum bhavnagarense TaxID=992286 RepID=A0A4V2SW61_9RHOB|nr:flagellar basal body-associated FliL family protein [Rhodovulum bhavnagarense]TCP61186.1 hypothetical protein EV663_106134 [Rhodovulum bhavnagarense]